jgi:predicted nucleotide-binding protein (sugar kinase/HSP70/actin superfamily)
MIERINRTEEIREKLIRESKVSFLDSPAQKEAINRLNEELAEVRRDYKVKEKNSFETASKVVLTGSSAAPQSDFKNC